MPDKRLEDIKEYTKNYEHDFATPHIVYLLLRLEAEVKRREAAEALLLFVSNGPWDDTETGLWAAWQRLVKEAIDA